MSKPRKRQFIEESDSVEYLHMHAWRVVKRQINYAERNKKGALYDDLVAMVFASHCIEGYANFLGERIAPELWMDEKRHFRDAGLAGKLDKIIELCGITDLDKGKRPYSTILALKILRDSMAHPRTIRAKGRKTFTEGKEPPLFAKSYLENLVSHKKAIRVRDDLNRLANHIHNAALVRFRDKQLGTDALEGIIGLRSTSMTLDPTEIV